MRGVPGNRCPYRDHDIPVHIRQPEIAALEAIGQLRVVEAEQVQNGGVQIVDVDFVLRRR